MRQRTVALLLLFVGAACGGGTDADVAPTSTVAPQAPVEGAVDAGASANGGSTAAQPSKAAADKDAASGAAADGSASTTTPKSGDPSGQPKSVTSGPPTPLDVTLAHTCVKVGDSQTITIKSPEGSGAGYDTYYPDGKSGISEGFYGGNKGTVMPPSGEWSDTWVVAVNAPPGKVRVTVQSIKLHHSVSSRELTFDLVPATGICP